MLDSACMQKEREVIERCWIRARKECFFFLPRTMRTIFYSLSYQIFVLTNISSFFIISTSEFISSIEQIKKPSCDYITFAQLENAFCTFFNGQILHKIIITNFNESHFFRCFNSFTNSMLCYLSISNPVLDCRRCFSFCIVSSMQFFVGFFLLKDQKSALIYGIDRVQCVLSRWIYHNILVAVYSLASPFYIFLLSFVRLLIELLYLFNTRFVHIITSTPSKMKRNCQRKC